ncbi:hypothetical protein C3L33_13665, partial [Rhododendron williamsianum]
MNPEQSRAAAQQEGGGGKGLGLTLLVTLLVAFFSLVLIPSLPAAKNSISILHQVPEGHVGVYWIGGALLKTITPPGFHVKMPLITHFEPIQVTLQTDLVVNRLHKDFVYDTLRDYGVQYDNTWIYDKIHHEINQFCSAHSLQQIDEKMKDALQADCTRYAPGIEIISVLIAVERQRVVEKEAETQKKVAISEAEKNAQVSMIQMEQKLMEKDSARRQEEISNEMYKAREKSLADADFYRRVLNESYVGPPRVGWGVTSSSGGECHCLSIPQRLGTGVIPNMVFDQRLLGNFFQDLTRNDNSEAESSKTMDAVG